MSKQQGGEESDEDEALYNLCVNRCETRWESVEVLHVHTMSSWVIEVELFFTLLNHLYKSLHIICRFRFLQCVHRF